MRFGSEGDRRSADRRTSVETLGHRDDRRLGNGPDALGPRDPLRVSDQGCGVRWKTETGRRIHLRSSYDSPNRGWTSPHFCARVPASQPSPGRDSSRPFFRIFAALPAADSSTFTIQPRFPPSTRSSSIDSRRRPASPESVHAFSPLAARGRARHLRSPLHRRPGTGVHRIGGAGAASRHRPAARRVTRGSDGSVRDSDPRGSRAGGLAGVRGTPCGPGGPRRVERPRDRRRARALHDARPTVSHPGIAHGGRVRPRGHPPGVRRRAARVRRAEGGHGPGDSGSRDTGPEPRTDERRDARVRHRRRRGLDTGAAADVRVRSRRSRGGLQRDRGPRCLRARRLPLGSPHRLSRGRAERSRTVVSPLSSSASRPVPVDVRARGAGGDAFRRL